MWYSFPRIVRKAVPLSLNPPPKSVMSQPRSFTDPVAAVDHLIEIYAQGRTLLERHFEKYANREPDLKKADARYPYLWVDVEQVELGSGGALSYGTVREPGSFGATVTHPELFRSYYLEQIGLLMENHHVPVWVGVSDRQIPLTFALESLTADLH